MNTYAYAINNPVRFEDPAGLAVSNNFFSPSQALYYFGLLHSEPGVYTILGHGDPGHFCGNTLCGTSGAEDYSPQHLADLIFNDSAYLPGMPIRLIACNTGVGSNSYAQQLANELGNLAVAAGRSPSDASRVYAPNGYILPILGAFLGLAASTLADQNIIIEGSVFTGSRGATPGQYLPFRYQPH